MTFKLNILFIHIKYLKKLGLYYILFLFTMKNLEQSKKYIFKRFILFCFDIFAIQPNFFIKSIAMAFYFFVVSFFL